MLKSICNQVVKPVEPEFPCLMVSENTGNIFIVLKKGSGLKVGNIEDAQSYIGNQIDSSLDCVPMKPYSGSVKLNQE